MNRWTRIREVSNAILGISVDRISALKWKQTDGQTDRRTTDEGDCISPPLPVLTLSVTTKPKQSYRRAAPSYTLYFQDVPKQQNHEISQYLST